MTEYGPVERKKAYRNMGFIALGVFFVVILLFILAILRDSQIL